MRKVWFTYLVLIWHVMAYSQINSIDLAIQKAHSSEIVQLEFSKSGRYLASAAQNNEFVIWDVYHEKSIATFTLSSIESVLGMKFNPNGEQLVVRTKRTTIIYDYAEEKLTQKLTADTIYRDKAYRFDKNSNYELYLKKGSIYKKRKDKRLQKYKLGVSYAGQSFQAFDVSVENNLLVGVTGNNIVYVYNYLNGSKKKELKGHNSAVNDVRFSQDGKYFATAGKDRSIIIWNAKTLEIHKRLASRIFRKKTATFSPDGQHIYVGDELGYVYDISFESAFPEINVARQNLHAVNKIQAHQTRFLLAGANNQVQLKNNPTEETIIEKYNYRDHSFIESKKLLLEQIGTYQESFGSVELMERSPNGRNMIYTGASEYPSINFATLNTGKIKRVYDYYNPKKWKDIDFISDSVFISMYDSSNVIFHWMIHDNEILKKTDTLPFVMEDFEVVGDNELWINTKHYGQYTYNIKTRLCEKKSDLSAISLFRANNYIVLQSFSGSLVFYDLDKNEVYNRFIGHKEFVTDLNFHPDGDKFVTSSDDGTVRLWSLKNKEQLAILIPFKNQEFIFITAASYYLTSKGAMDEIGFKVGGQFFYPDQFDLKYNRPDLVLAQMGFSNDNLISAYRKAYLKRIKKMGFTENDIRGDFNLPKISLSNLDDIPSNTDKEKVQFKILMSDEETELDRLNVWINDVAVFGSNGISLKNEAKREIEYTLDLEIADGPNKIEFSALNASGAESYKSTVQIEKASSGKRPNLYIASIGISKHEDSRYDLSYADKDAKDLVATFKKDNYFNEVKAVTLTNEEVKMENLAQLKTFLEQAQINDVVLVFIAGHGVLNAEFDYFFATHDMDFETPQKRGVPYEAIEKLLDGIKALKKMLFMDTCHSGELDKDEIEESSEDEEQGDLIFRNVGKSVKLKDNPLGLQNTNSLMKSLFTDLRKGTGATVISSSGGTELSIEGNSFNNGLFTYCLLNGLTTGAADLNKDKEIYISELQMYVKQEVNRLSNGLQTPTSRIQNRELDYRIW
jgi:WD40 repeat protein